MSEYESISRALNRIETFVGAAGAATDGRAGVVDDLAYLRGCLDRAFFGADLIAGVSDDDIALQEIMRAPRSDLTFASAPTFMIGHTRSGTTLLSWLLNTHPSIAVVPENQLCASLLAPRLSKHSPIPGRFSISKSCPIWSGLPSVEWLGEPRARYLARHAAVIDGVFRDYAQRQQKQRWIAKELLLYDRLDLLDAIFDYRAQFICVVRHGLDVAFSASAADRLNAEAMTTSSLVIERNLRSWVACNEAMADFYSCNRGRCVLIRYEDFVNSPETTSVRLFEALGERWIPTILDDLRKQPHPPGLGDPKILKTGGTIHRRSVARWAEWPEALVVRLARQANPTLIRFGYDPVSPEACARPLHAEA